MEIVKCPIDGKRYYNTQRCQSCPDTSIFCKERPQNKSNQDNDDKFKTAFLERYSPDNKIDIESYDAVLKIAKGLRLCLNCFKPLPAIHDIDLSKYDYDRCEKTGINDKCYLFGKRCRDVKSGNEICRNVKPESTWADEAKKTKYTNSIMIEGKVNIRKRNKVLKELGVQHVEYKNTDDYRGGVAKARYFFIQKYEIAMEPKTDKEYCKKCKKARNNKTYQNT